MIRHLRRLGYREKGGEKTYTVNREEKTIQLSEDLTLTEKGETINYNKIDTQDEWIYYPTEDKYFLSDHIPDDFDKEQIDAVISKDTTTYYIGEEIFSELLYGRLNDDRKYLHADFITGYINVLTREWYDNPKVTVFNTFYTLSWDLSLIHI